MKVGKFPSACEDEFQGRQKTLGKLVGYKMVRIRLFRYDFPANLAERDGSEKARLLVTTGGRFGESYNINCPKVLVSKSAGILVFIRLFLSFFLFLQLLQLASNAEALKLPHISVDLKAELKEVQPGDVAVLGLLLTPEEGWHIYWKNPGDTGATPKFRWDIQSSSLKLSATHWPIPQRFTTKHLVNFGYSEPTALLFDFQVNSDAQEGDELTVDLDAELLICKDECIPVQGQFRESFKVVGSGDEGAAKELDSESAEIFKRVRRQLPQLAAPGLVKAKASDEKVVFDLSSAINLNVIDLFPAQRGVFSSLAPEKISANQIALERLKGREIPSVLEVVLVVGSQEAKEAYDIAIPLTPSTGGPIAVADNLVGEKDGEIKRENLSALPVGLSGERENLEALAEGFLPGFLGALVFALLGGLILNLMPCVLPVLGLKLFEIIEGRTHGNRGMRRDALAYTSGVVVSMVILATILLIFRGGASQLGWGFQLQSPIFVAIMALVIFALGLSFVGLLEVATPAFVSRAKVTGPFSSGVLATLLATPCTAPFMGTALAYALTRTVFEALVVFMALGLGIALPYLMVAFIPSLARILPRPGAWMIFIKELLAFPLFATVMWLLWVLGNQSGVAAVVAVTSGCLLLGLAGWLLHRAKMSVNRIFIRAAKALAVCVSVLAVVVAVVPLSAESKPGVQGVALRWTSFSQQRLNDLIESGRPVFVDFTAEWCITCKVNEKLVLNLHSVKQAFKDKDFVMVKADWTDGNPEIGLALKRLNRQGVPVYVVYRKRGDKVESQVLPTLLTPGIIQDAIAKFGG